MGAVKDFLKKTPVLPIYRGLKAGYKEINKQRKKLIKRYTYHVLFPRIYNKYRKNPVEEDKILFVENRFPEITESFQVLYDVLAKEYRFQIHSHFLKDVSSSAKEYRRRCRDLLQDLATAKYVFVNDASAAVSCVKLRPETVVVNVWHGCGAFKKFGYSTAELIFGLSRKEMDQFPNYKNLTYVTVSSPEVVWAYEDAMDLKESPGVVVPSGISRTDIFFQEEYARLARERLLKIMPSAAGKKIILYAPTFRGRVAKATMPNMLDVELFMRELGDEYVLLIKHHPLVKKPPAVPAGCRTFALNVTRAMAIDELLCISDICISDYSSLVFEFSLFEKPMIFYAFDLKQYFDWRGFYYDYFELAPGPVFGLNWEVVDYIKHIDERFDKQRVIDFKNKFMSSCDGHSTERILNMAVGEEVLAKYRREEPRPGSYYKLPSETDRLYGETALRDQEQLRKMAKKAPVLYRKAGRNINPKKVVMVRQRPRDTEIWTPLYNSLNKKEGVVCEIVDFDERKNPPLPAFFKAVGDAAFILLMYSCPPLNAVDIRPETKVIQVGFPVFPLYRTDCASRKVENGFLDTQLAILPLHKGYDMVTVSSEQLREDAARRYGVSKEICRPMGCLGMDLLHNKNLRKQTEEKLKNEETGLFPAMGDRKIILYMPSCRNTLVPPITKVFMDQRILYEYLKDDYVIVCHFSAPKKQRPKIASYYGSFIRDLSADFTVHELLAAADIVIGDYRSEIFEVAAAGKPLFLYVPDKETYLKEEEQCYSYQDVMPGVEVEDAQDLCRKVLDIVHYDDSNRRKFVEMYLGNTRGNMTKRMTDWIWNHMENK